MEAHETEKFPADLERGRRTLLDVLAGVLRFIRSFTGKRVTTIQWYGALFISQNRYRIHLDCS
jgi:hypothetical protein